MGFEVPEEQTNKEMAHNHLSVPKPCIRNIFLLNALTKNTMLRVLTVTVGLCLALPTSRHIKWLVSQLQDALGKAVKPNTVAVQFPAFCKPANTPAPVKRSTSWRIPCPAA